MVLPLVAETAPEHVVPVPVLHQAVRRAEQARSIRVQNDIAAGAVSDQEITYTLIALARDRAAYAVQDHGASAAELHQAIHRAAQARQENLAKLNGFVSSRPLGVLHHHTRGRSRRLCSLRQAVHSEAGAR